MLKIQDLHLKIGQTRVLNGVELSVSKGEQLGIIGPNGSGKTTLFNCISGFLTPAQGSIRFKDQDITHLPPHRKAELGLGRVFQNFGIFKEMTVMENMVAALEGRDQALLFPWSRKYKEFKKRSIEHLEMVGLVAKAEDKAGSLSGGQMRLLEIARSIAFESELFLLDEPTAGVSPKMKGEVENLLHRLKGLGKTIMIIEHDLTFIQRLCERIVVLDLGKVVLDGSPENVRNNTMLQEIYFGSNSSDQQKEAKTV